MPVASRRLAKLAGAQAAGLSLALSGTGWLALRWSGVEVALPIFVLITAVATCVAGLCTAFYVEHSVGRRTGKIARILEQYAKQNGLQRLPDLGDDEIGEIGRAVNDLLAKLTSLEVRMIEQGQELRKTREELISKTELGLKSADLEQRLRERALLFDIVRASASERELDAVLDEIATRLGNALHLRECMLFLADTETRRLTLRAAYGFERPGELLESSCSTRMRLATWRNRAQSR
jgi:methyl-accepting chemotaxis protein